MLRDYMDKIELQENKQLDVYMNLKRFAEQHSLSKTFRDLIADELNAYMTARSRYSRIKSSTVLTEGMVSIISPLIPKPEEEPLPEDTQMAILNTITENILLVSKNNEELFMALAPEYLQVINRSNSDKWKNALLEICNILKTTFIGLTKVSFLESLLPPEDITTQIDELIDKIESDETDYASLDDESQKIEAHISIFSMLDQCMQVHQNVLQIMTDLISNLSRLYLSQFKSIVEE